MSLKNQLDQTLHQYNLSGRYHSDISSRYIFTGDLTGDNNPEIAVLTQDSNLIYLHIIDPTIRDSVWIRNFFVDSISIRNARFDYTYNFFPESVKQKNSKELLFWLNAGFSRNPRKVYLFDPARKDLKKSVEMSYCRPTAVVDLDGDRELEIVVSNYAVSNDQYEDTVFPNDNFTYLTVLTHDLALKFSPPVVGKTRSNIIAIVKKKENQQYILCACRDMQNDTNSYFVNLYDGEGNFIRNHLLSRGSDKHRDLTNVNDRIYFIEGGDVYEILPDLSISPVLERAFNSNVHLISHYNHTRIGDELIAGLYIDSKKLFLIKNMKEVIDLGIPADFYNGFSFSQLNDLHGNLQIAVQNGNRKETMVIKETSSYKFRFPVLIAIYLSALILVLLIRRALQLQIGKKQEAERQLAALKARALKNQIDPHFTLNALNAIAGMVNRNSPEEAYGYIIKFSRMIQNVLSRSDELFTTLGQEVEFVQDYLDLQQLRYPNLFTYDLIIDEEVKMRRLIPKMIIQTFAENAVKHGLKPKKSGGRLLIKIEMEGHMLKIRVEDNGVGRRIAEQRENRGTGSGLKIVHQIMDILKSHSKEPAGFDFSDLKDENGKACGTRVDIMLPEFGE